MVQNLPALTVARPDHAAVQQFEGGVGNVEVGDEDEEPQTLEEGMATQPLGEPAHLGPCEQQQQQEEGEDVERRGILQPQPTQGRQVRGQAQVEGEVWVEEGQVLERLIVGSPCQQNVQCLQTEGASSLPAAV